VHSEAPRTNGEATNGNGRGRRRRRRGRRGGEARENGAPSEEAAGLEFVPPEFVAPEPSDVHGDELHDGAEPAAPATTGEARDREEADSRGDRHRRRGRRGGRRNRRDGEAPRSAADTAAAEFDGELGTSDTQNAQAFGEHGARESLPQEAAREETRKHELESAESVPPPPEAAPPAPVTDSAPAASAPRRRSTVREPAPVVIGRHSGAESEAPPAVPLESSASPPSAAPAPEPDVSASTESENGRPRRSGWWSRRVLGKG
jgi:ribonuclease E